MTDNSLKVEIVVIDKASRALGTIGTAFSVGLGTLAVRGITALGRGLDTTARKLVGIAGDSINLAMDFEEQMAILDAAVSDTNITLDDLSDLALQAGADTSLIGVNASEVAESMTGLYKAGLTTNEIFGDMHGYMEGTAELGGALRASIDLAAASELDLAAASDAVSIAMATFGLDASEATRIADSFVQSADASNAEVEDLTGALDNAGPTMAAFGFSLEDTNAALAILSTRGISGPEGGTALKSMFTNLMRDTDDTTEALADLNIELYNADGTMKELPEIIGDLSGAMSGLTEKERNYYTQQIAGTYGMKAMQTLVAEGTEGWADMEQAVAEAATAQDIAEKRAETFKEKLEALKDVVETVQLQFGNALLDGLLPFVEGIGDYLSEHSDEIQIVFENLGKELGKLAEETLPDVLEALEDIDWEDIADKVGFVTDAIRHMISTFDFLTSSPILNLLQGTVVGDTLEGWADSLGKVVDAWFALLNPIEQVGNYFKTLDADLPDWLVPGSPTPLEIGLRGIRGEMVALVGDAPPVGAAAAGGVGAAMANQYMSVYGGIHLNGVQDHQGLLAELQGMMP